MNFTRRQLLELGSAATMLPMTRAFEARPLFAQTTAAPTGPFTLPPLPYPADALEPHIDAQTMTIHHDRHHAAYVTNLNAALANDPDLKSRRLTTSSATSIRCRRPCAGPSAIKAAGT